MKTHHLLHLVWFSLLGAILTFSSPALAAGDPQIDRARDLLHDAWNPGGDTPSNDVRIQKCQAALELLQKSAAVYHGQRAKAIEFTKEALSELKRGDPDDKAKEFIRQAVDMTRDIT